jgi:cell division protein FtsB
LQCVVEVVFVDTRTREELAAENALLKERVVALEAEVERLRNMISGGGGECG